MKYALTVLYCPALTMALEFVRQQVVSHKVVIFSEVSCRYSKSAKKALRDSGCLYPTDMVVYELDQLVDGPDLKRALKIITGQSTVPQVNTKASTSCKTINFCHSILSLARSARFRFLLAANISEVGTVLWNSQARASLETNSRTPEPHSSLQTRYEL